MALVEGKHTGEFIVSEANGSRSRETGTVVSGQNLVAGEVVAIVTASGKYSKYVDGAVDGTGVVAGIMFDNVDATLADVAGAVIIKRDAEVRGSDVTFNEAVAGVITVEVAELKALGIIVR